MPNGLRRRRRRTIDTSAYLTMCARLLSAGGGRVAEGNLEDFRQLLELRTILDEALLEAVRGLRDAGVTWDEIGAVTGHTRQAAIKRWNGSL